jgi:outer membrane protein OmpA-like peptidoglycan-associated protein
MPRQSVITSTIIGLMCGTSAAGEIVLELGGVHYDGGSAFSVTFDGAAVGTGTLDPAGEQLQGFRFEVPDETLQAGGDLTISFTNDINLGPDRDRSLLVFGARIGTYTLTAGEFVLVNALTGERIDRPQDPALALWTNEEIAVAPSPPNGWIAAEAATMPAQADCARPLSISGFPIDGVDLSKKQHDALRFWAGAVPVEQCRIEVIGFASPGGGDDVNQIIAMARAKSVGDALMATGFPAERMEMKSGGATSRFGPAASDNRRVEVRLAGATTATTALEPEAAGARMLMLTLGEDDRVAVEVQGGLSRPEQLWVLEAAKAQLLKGAAP